MKYYAFQKYSNNLNSPVILNSADKLKLPHIYRGQTGYMPSHTVLNVEGNRNTEYSDVLFRPLPLFSVNIKKTLDIFIRDLQYRQVVLMEEGRSQSSLYFFPLFESVPIEAVVIGKAGGTATYALPAASVTERCAMYIYTGTEIHMILRLDLIESLLRAGATGFKISPVELV